MSIDATHDPALPCFVASAAGHADFPIQNLPLGVFAPPDGKPRGGMAIGDAILDLSLAAPLLRGAAAEAAELAAAPQLNALLAAGAEARRALRAGVSALLSGADPRLPGLIRPARDCTLHLPCAIGDYTDFYAGIHHATNTGQMLRPENPLLPNYKYVPVAYHGRASSVRLSGMPVRRPHGQRKPAAAAAPEFGPSRNLDYELELGIWIGPGNEPGTPIPIGEAGAHIAGFCLLNDWSARDIQAWEYQPLGPFLAKNFATSISPWIVTAEAMAPFRAAQPPRPAGDPAPLPYLWDDADQAGGALDLDLSVALETSAMRAAGLAAQPLSRVNAQVLYWTVAQMVAHHASGGCDLRPGDLFGSGTLSGSEEDARGSLLEIIRGGRVPLSLPNGETRRFLEDGDRVIFTARATRSGFAPIGFGVCEAEVAPA
ncbi:MAG: fumarylacetoacetase [Rhodospirillales bacterium]|nr:fumarylacetoacetase [Rhodospirillales bacterium]